MKVVKGVLYVVFLILVVLSVLCLQTVENGFDVSRFLIGVLLVIASGIDYATVMIIK